MPREIERKFLIDDDRWRVEWQRAGGSVSALRQYYLDIRADFSARVRIVDGARAFLTLKTGAGLSRGEFEYEIPMQDAVDLEVGRIGVAVEKRRHRIPHGAYTVEVDVFAGVHAPLVIAEIELASETDAVDLPPYLGREITGDPAFSNAQLALSGQPSEAAAD